MSAPTAEWSYVNSGSSPLGTGIHHGLGVLAKRPRQQAMRSWWASWQQHRPGSAAPATTPQLSHSGCLKLEPLPEAIHGRRVSRLLELADLATRTSAPELAAGKLCSVVNSLRERRTIVGDAGSQLVFWFQARYRAADFQFHRTDACGHRFGSWLEETRHDEPEMSNGSHKRTPP